MINFCIKVELNQKTFFHFNPVVKCAVKIIFLAFSQTGEDDQTTALLCLEKGNGQLSSLRAFKDGGYRKSDFQKLQVKPIPPLPVRS